MANGDNDDDDVFDDTNEPNEELLFSSKEFERDLNRIENSAFHEAFKESREKSAQKSFDTGYEISFPFFQAVAHLEGINDVLFYNLPKDDKIRLCDIKIRISALYAQLIQDLEQQMNADIENKRYNKETNIKPSGKIIEEFNDIKMKIIETSSNVNIMNFDTKFINEIKSITL